MKHPDQAREAIAAYIRTSSLGDGHGSDLDGAKAAAHAADLIAILTDVEAGRTATEAVLAHHDLDETELRRLGWQP